MKSRKLLSQWNPLLYFLSVWIRRVLCYRKWYLSSTKFAQIQSKESFPIRVKKHQSLLIRKLGDSDVQLQCNKVVNLKLATQKIDGIMIKPGETFSFCKLVGRPTAKKVYFLGTELSFGIAQPGIGGGFAAIAQTNIPKTDFVCQSKVLK